MGKNVFEIRSVSDSQNYCINVYVGEVCNFLGSISAQQIFEAMDGPVLQLSFIGKQRKIYPQGMRAGRPKRSAEWRGEALGSILAPLFMFFLLPLSLPYVKWARQEGCLFYLRFYTQTFLCSIFMGFSLLCLLAILYSFFLF